MVLERKDFKCERAKKEKSSFLCKNCFKANLQIRTRNNRVCNSCGRSCCNCNIGNCDFQTKTSRALGRNCQWNECVVKIKNKGGQSSTEFAIVFGIIIVIIIGIAAIFKCFNAGIFLDHAIMAASHNVVDSVMGIVDAILY